MAQAVKSPTTNRLHFASAGAVRQRQAQPVNLALSADQMKTLWELCALAAYHPSGFSYTEEMEAVTRFIADKSGPAAIATCLARADIRERSIVRR
jgi:hypothetical protein